MNVKPPLKRWLYYLYICCMASVNVVYNTLKGLANKDQKGFITPEAFNEFAPIAQVRIYNRLFDRLKDAHRNSRANFDPGRDKSLHKRILEDLSVFQRVIVINRTDGVFPYPENFSRAIAATTNGSVVLGQSTRIPIELCYDEDKVDRILRNRVSKPKDDFPMAFMSESIEVFPSSINRIRLSYYKRPEGKNLIGQPVPSQPSYSGTDVGNVNLFDAAASIDFELPDHMINDIVVEMAELMGVKLRDSEMTSYSIGEQQQIKTDQSFN